MHGPQGSLESPVKFVISMHHMMAPRMSSSARKKKMVKKSIKKPRGKSLNPVGILGIQ